MPRFSDCVSCAFHHVEPAICSDCRNADQWEPTDDVSVTPLPGGIRKVFKIIKIRNPKEEQ